MQLTMNSSVSNFIMFDPSQHIGCTIARPHDCDVVVSAYNIFTLYRSGERIQDVTFNRHPSNMKAALGKLFRAAESETGKVQSSPISKKEHWNYF